MGEEKYCEWEEVSVRTRIEGIPGIFLYSDTLKVGPTPLVKAKKGDIVAL